MDGKRALLYLTLPVHLNIDSRLRMPSRTCPAGQARESDAREGVPAAARSSADASTIVTGFTSAEPSGPTERNRYVRAEDIVRAEPSGVAHADPVRFAFFRARRAFGTGRLFGGAALIAA